MSGLIATLTWRGRVLRALVAAGVVGAAACQDAGRAVGPTKEVRGPSALALNPNPLDPTSQPDLMVASITYAPANPLVGLPIRFSAVVRNIGLTTAGASILGFGGWAPASLRPLSSAQTIFLSPCTLPLADGQVSVPALGPGEEYLVHWTAHLQDGQYRITATANSRQCTPEASLSNNSALVDFWVTIIN